MPCVMFELTKSLLCSQTAICQTSTNQTECPLSFPDMVRCLKSYHWYSEPGVSDSRSTSFIENYIPMSQEQHPMSNIG